MKIGKNTNASRKTVQLPYEGKVVAGCDGFVLPSRAQMKSTPFSPKQSEIAR